MSPPPSGQILYSPLVTLQENYMLYGVSTWKNPLQVHDLPEIKAVYL